MKISGLLNLIKNNLGLILIVLALTFGFFYGKKVYRSEMQRMENNYLAAVKELRKENQEQGRAYFLSIAEVNRQFPEIKKQLSEMGVKMNSLVSAQNVNTTTVNNVNTILRDTTIRDTILAQRALYKTEWIEFSLLKVNDSIHAKIVTKDSLFIALYRVKRNFREWISGEPKQVRSEVKTFSPYSNITYNRYIQIQK